MAAPDVTPEELRPLLFSLAYRMVGGVGEAEDLVQEAFLRFHRAPRARRSPKAFLTTVVDAAGDRPPALGARAARDLRRAVAARAAGRATPAPGPADRARTRRSRSRSWRCSSGSRPSSARSTCCTSCSATRTTRSRAIVGKSSANCRQILGARAAPRRAGTAALRAVAARARGAARALPRRRRAPATSRRWSTCSPPTPSPTPTAAARRPRRGCRSTAPAKVARLWAKLGTDSAPAALRLADVNGQPGVVAPTRTGAWSACSRSRSPAAACRRSGRW